MFVVALAPGVSAIAFSSLRFHASTFLLDSWVIGLIFPGRSNAALLRVPSDCAVFARNSQPSNRSNRLTKLHVHGMFTKNTYRIVTNVTDMTTSSAPI
jgi:hypothetical protein